MELIVENKLNLWEVLLTVFIGYVIAVGVGWVVKKLPPRTISFIDMSKHVDKEVKDYNIMVIEKLNVILKEKYNTTLKIEIRYTKLDEGVVGSSYPKHKIINLDWQLANHIPMTYTDTVIHEFAHVANYHVLGNDMDEETKGHGPGWVAMAKSLGAIPNAFVANKTLERVYDFYYGGKE